MTEIIQSLLHLNGQVFLLSGLALMMKMLIQVLHVKSLQEAMLTSVVYLHLLTHLSIMLLLRVLLHLMLQMQMLLLKKARLFILLRNSSTENGTSLVMISVFQELTTTEALSRDSLTRTFGYSLNTMVRCLTVTAFLTVLHSSASVQCTKMTLSMMNSRLLMIHTLQAERQMLLSKKLLIHLNSYTTDSGMQVISLWLTVLWQHFIRM